jgi:undecaprenyl diphosphate synthase
MSQPVRADSSSAPADLVEYVDDTPEAQTLLDAIDWSRLPRQVAIIMDGNGRWAKDRGLPRVDGHKAGITAVREAVETAARAGLGALTLYAFSVENWKRPRSEIDALMELLKEYLARELPTLLRHSIRFSAIGRLEGLPEDVQRDIRAATAATAANTGLRFVIALNYGGRTEIVDALRDASADIVSGALAPEDLDEEKLSEYLYTRDLPELDLLIRTSGELRVSNFLLYQIAYAEIWVTEKLWPDFRRLDMLQAIADFQRRERRYGGVTSDAGQGEP